MTDPNTTTFSPPATRVIVEQMSRKDFNSYLFGLFQCEERGVANDAKADVEYDHNGIDRVEVFATSDGLVVAVHSGPTLNNVEVIRLATPLNEGMRATRPMPLSEIANHLRTRPSLSPAIQQLVDKSHERAEAPADDFDIQQVAIILKAAEIAAANSDHPANFNFAAGYLAGMYLGDVDVLKAKAIAETL